MPSVTRSQTRRQLEYLKTDPYPTSFLAGKYPGSTAKFEELLKRETTPDPEEVTKELVNIAKKLEQEVYVLERENSRQRGLHLLGDILSKSLNPMRKHIKDNTTPKLRISDSVKEWKWKGINDDTCAQANLIRDYIK